ncbi:hypothetical protein [Thalassotalea sp. PS06]|uniref:hypothetical protein n=1 Tax=Thalassotalea sp. PS06 TaxID=2594005 RepID=UPI0011639C56|nr:hypothetical protein [Thalassotalea sp. PS06]QDO99978.1 hypothetical protein FNC98_00650 [Thalassotalea sp. PS06]
MRTELDSKLPEKLIITGGMQRRFHYDMKEWTGYAAAKALEISFADDISVKEVIDYASPKDCLPDDDEASITFKSGTRHSQKLWVATQTEALCFSTRDFSLQHRISHPVFNDVHHVYPTRDETLLITSTGLDAVFEFSESGEKINEWSCTEMDIWQRFDPRTDYRKVLTTKPHAVHPNHCFEYLGKYWVSNMKKSQCQCLQTGEVISLDSGNIHDGILVGKYAYFTHVNGFISKVDMDLQRVVQVFDMNKAQAGPKQLGWCRGLYFIDDNRFLVGFTRIRPSKMQMGMEWLKNRFYAKGWQGCLPTRICLFNTQSMTFEWQLDLEQHDIHAVFSIL